MSVETSLHPRSGGLLLASLCGMAAYGVTYALGGMMLFYLPVEDVWTFHPPEGAVRISYFGLVLNGVLGALVGGIMGRVPWMSARLERFSTVRWLSRAVLALFALIWLSSAVKEGSHWLVSGHDGPDARISGAASTGRGTMGENLKEGDPAPDFRLQDGAGRWLTREEISEEGPLVVFFYPRDDTPGCTAEACGFQSSLGEFEELGATVVGVSADSVGSHRAFADHHGLTYPLLSDPDNEMRRAFRVPKVMGLLPGRSTFVIDGQGTIRHVHHGQLDPVGHVKAALEATRRL
ncbi:MAG: peroxiredoxin [Myxococcota bacterium]|nr:peroxiredoxin [Myxococcota bacterium]